MLDNGRQQAIIGVVRTSEVIAHFGSQTKVALAIGVSRSAVQQWGEKVPPLSAAKIAKVTRGRIKFDPFEYEDWYTQPKKRTN